MYTGAGVKALKRRTCVAERSNQSEQYERMARQQKRKYDEMEMSGMGVSNSATVHGVSPQLFCGPVALALFGLVSLPHTYHSKVICPPHIGLVSLTHTYHSKVICPPHIGLVSLTHTYHSKVICPPHTKQMSSY